MSELINFFPTLLLGMMVALTLILLPLLQDEPPRRDERQRTDPSRLQLESRTVASDGRTGNAHDES